MGQQSVSLQQNGNVGGISFGATLTLTGDADVGATASMPVAQPGVVTTHTSSTDVVLTMTNSGHGIANGQRCDLYWAGGYRRGMAASNVSGTSVELTGGTGDNCPAATTAIIVGLCVKRSFSVINANLQIIACQSNFESVFAFLESDDSTEDWYAHLVPGQSNINVVSMWYNGGGASPVTGTAIFEVYMSHADVNNVHVMSAAALATA